MAQMTEIKKAREEHSREIKDFLEPYRQLNSGMSDTKIWLADLTKQYRDAIIAGKEMGLTQSQLDEIRKAQFVEIKKQRESELQSAKDIIAKNSMGEVAWEIKLINDQFNEQRETLKALGATAADLNIIEQARNITLQEQKRASIKEEDYATRVDYERAMFSLPSLDVGTNYMPYDGPIFAHKGEAIVPYKYNQRADETNADLLKEIKLLRQENKALGEANAKSMDKLNRFFSNFDDGDALTVRVAV
jgi:hypothetical protein